MAAHRYLARAFLALLGLAVLAYIGLSGFSAQNTLKLLVCLACLAVMYRVLIPLLDQLSGAEQRANRGAEAEEKIGALLNALPGRYIVLHDVTARYGNIDHLVFRDDGAVFLLETKSHHGTVTAHGDDLRRNGWRFEKNFIKQTHRNLFWLRDFLRVRLGVEPHIHAAIVFPNANVAVHKPIQGIHVLRGDAIRSWISSTPNSDDLAPNLWPNVQAMKQQLLALPRPSLVPKIVLPLAIAVFSVGALVLTAILPLVLIQKTTDSILHPPAPLLGLNLPLPSTPSLPATAAAANSNPTLQRAPTVEQIKADAERGNPVAQDKLGDIYRNSGNCETAVLWYRKAAPHGILNSQYQLAHILLSWANSSTTKPAMVAEHSDEALPWLAKAANQGEGNGQYELGQIYREGRYVAKDLPEAYKWLSLAAQSRQASHLSVSLANTYRDSMTLKMTQAEIAEGKRRLAAFSVSASDSAPPEPLYVQQIRLQGISGVPPRALAIINGKTFATGESGSVKVGPRFVNVHCLAVTPTSATVSIDGAATPKQLLLP
jgi:hypothetical protein